MSRVYLSLLFLFVAVGAFAGENTNTWSGTYYRLYTNDTSNIVFVVDAMKEDITNAVAERAAVLGETYTRPTTNFYSGGRTILTNAKEWVQTYLTNFVNTSYATNGTFNDYFDANPTETNFPVWTESDLLSYVGAPTNYFTYTPQRGLSHPDTENGWKYMDDLLRELRWVQRTATIDETYDIKETYLFETDTDADSSGIEDFTQFFDYNANCEWFEDTTSGTGITSPTYDAYSTYSHTADFPTNTSASNLGDVTAFTYQAEGLAAVYVEGTQNWYTVYTAEYEAPPCTDTCWSTTAMLDWLNQWTSNQLYGSRSTIGADTNSTAFYSQYTTGSWNCVTYTNCEVDIYTLLTPLSATQYTNVSISYTCGYDDGTYTTGSVDVVAAGDLLGCRYENDQTNYVNPWHMASSGTNITMTGTVDLWKGLTTLPGWTNTAFETTVAVTNGGTFVWHLTNSITAVTNMYTSLSGAFSDSLSISDSDDGLAYGYCDDGTNCLSTVDTAFYQDYHYSKDAYSDLKGYAVNDPGGPKWGCTRDSHLILTRYDVAGGFSYFIGD